MERLKIEKLLDKLQIKFNLLGYRYWITVIEIYRKDNKMNIKKIYQIVAEKYKTTPSGVERALRYSYTTSKKYIKDYFKIEYQPTTKRLLAILSREIDKQMEGVE